MTSSPAPDASVAPADARGRRRWVAALACAAAGTMVFHFFGNANRGYIDTASLFHWWGFQWFNPRSETEHGLLVVALAAWLGWRNWGAGRKEQEEGRAAAADAEERGGVGVALGAMVAGLALHAVGFVAQQARLSIVAFLLCTWGVLQLGGGRRWGAAAAFPVAFMIFAIPINVLDSVGFWLRVWVVDASAWIARAVGIGVLQSGTQLVSADGAYNYDVAAACSGIRSLTAMVALSLLAGYLNFHAWSRRALVLLACLPLVYLGNVARIVAIIFAAEAGGARWGDVAHEVMGYGIFAIVLGGVLGAIAALRRWWPEPSISDFGLRISDRESPESEIRHPRLADGRAARPCLIAAVVVLVAVGEMWFLHHLRSLPPRGRAGVVLADDGVNPAELPAFVGTEWIGRRAEVTAIEREILPADTGYSRRVYVDVATRREVLLSIVLSGRDRTSIHRPELCLVGQGWTIAESLPHRFRHPGGDAASFEATVLRVQREMQTPRGKVVVPQLVAYWFVGGEQVVASHWRRVLLDSFNRVFRGRSDRWAYVLMQTDARDGEAAALARMQAVLDGTLPAFQPPLAAR